MGITGAFLGGGAAVVPAGYCQLVMQLNTYDRRNIEGATFKIYQGKVSEANIDNGSAKLLQTINARADGRAEAMVNLKDGTDYTVLAIPKSEGDYINDGPQWVVAQNAQSLWVYFDFYAPVGEVGFVVMYPYVQGTYSFTRLEDSSVYTGDSVRSIEVPNGTYDMTFTDVLNNSFTKYGVNVVGQVTVDLEAGAFEWVGPPEAYDFTINGKPCSFPVGVFVPGGATFTYKVGAFTFVYEETRTGLVSIPMPGTYYSEFNVLNSGDNQVPQDGIYSVIIIGGGGGGGGSGAESYGYYGTGGGGQGGSGRISVLNDIGLTTDDILSLTKGAGGTAGARGESPGGLSNVTSGGAGGSGGTTTLAKNGERIGSSAGGSGGKGSTRMSSNTHRDGGADGGNGGFGGKGGKGGNGYSPSNGASSNIGLPGGIGGKGLDAKGGDGGNGGNGSKDKNNDYSRGGAGGDGGDGIASDTGITVKGKAGATYSDQYGGNGGEGGGYFVFAGKTYLSASELNIGGEGGSGGAGVNNGSIGTDRSAVAGRAGTAGTDGGAALILQVVVE